MVWIVVAAPALTNNPDTTAGFNPQELLQNALQWVDSLRVGGGIAFGATGVSLKDYALGSIGMIPGTVMYVYIGSLAGDLARIGTSTQPGDPVVQWIIRLLGFIATVAVTLYVTQVAHKALEEKVSPNPD